MESAQGSAFFGDWSQIEKLSEIKQPLVNNCLPFIPHGNQLDFFHRLIGTPSQGNSPSIALHFPDLMIGREKLQLWCNEQNICKKAKIDQAWISANLSPDLPLKVTCHLISNFKRLEGLKSTSTKKRQKVATEFDPDPWALCGYWMKCNH